MVTHAREKRPAIGPRAPVCRAGTAAREAKEEADDPAPSRGEGQPVATGARSILPRRLASQPNSPRPAGVERGNQIEGRAVLEGRIERSLSGEEKASEVAPLFGASPSANPVGRKKRGRSKLHAGTRRSRERQRGETGRRMVRAGALTLSTAIVLPAVAVAQSGGTGTGGAGFTATPTISAVKCVSACASRKRPRVGSTLRLTGSGMSAVTQVI